MGIVEGVYRVLGAIAPINQRMWRFRVNFVPANLILMFALGVMASICWRSTVTVLQSRRAPAAQPLGALLSGGRPTRNFVALEGRLAADARLSFGKNGAPGNLELADHTWAPLRDDATGKAILVQFAAGYSFPAPGTSVRLEGMLRPVTSAVSKRLAQTKYMHAGIPIERRFMLVEGRRPGPLVRPAVVGSVCTILVLAMAWATLTRNVIFMPDDSPSPGWAGAVAGQTPELLLVSGTLALDAKTRRFFTNMPAIIRRLDTGDTAIVSHIETKSTYMGMTTEQHSGLWVLAMRPGSMTETQAGHVFWGRQKLRAIRFRYISATTGQSERAVVACAAADPMLMLHAA